MINEIGTFVRGNTKATQKQIEFATSLIKELGYDLDDYNLEEMHRAEMRSLIDDLRIELG